MKTRKILFQCLLVVSLFVSANTIVENFSQWRGSNRNGIYPGKGLQNKWPEGGLRMIWSFEGLGAGHGNVGPGKDMIFILGMPDTTGVLYAFNYNGTLLWKKRYGSEWHQNYAGPRSTPVVVGERVYFESGTGTVFCNNAITGDKIWSVDLVKKFDAKIFHLLQADFGNSYFIFSLSSLMQAWLGHPSIKNPAAGCGSSLSLRREGDSNPRYPFEVHTLSRRAS